MDVVRLAVAVFALLVAAPAQADPVDRWRAFTAEAAARCAIPAVWIERVMRAESGGRTMADDEPITSRAGAMGLMQLMPATWSALRARYGLGNDPFDPHDNIVAGACYLRLMYDRFGYPGMFAAYNAGPTRYAAYLAGDAALPEETVRYVGRVAGSRPSDRAHRAAADAIFAVRAGAPDALAAKPGLFFIGGQ